jgi:uncharacterized membrane protein
MRERNLILILVIIFVIIGAFAFYYSSNYNKFNFYKSEVTVEGKTITEKLYFKTDKPYHTLYRNFADPIYALNQNPSSNSIHILDVKCDEGQPYVRDIYSSCTQFQNTSLKMNCPAYTENNEYGCTFGYTYGFKEDAEYWIESKYELNPENLFLIDGSTYIKFVAYSENNHIDLNRENFVVNGDATREGSYSPKENVILYIPYNNTPGSNIIKKPSFEFDNGLPETILTFFMAFSPALLIFFVWWFFGREHTYADIPPELSMYPTERKPWEVAAYFNPPFNVLDQNFFSAMLIDFYNRKIIDIQIKNKNVMVKVNETKEKLDKIEKDFLELISGFFKKNPEKKFLGFKYSESHIENGYLDLNAALGSFSNRAELTLSFKEMHKEVKNLGKKYVDTKGHTVLYTLFIIAYLFLHLQGFSFLNLTAAILMFLALITASIVSANSSLFVKFNEHYYREYQHWQAYKKFLSNSFSIKSHGHKGVIIWDKILVYGTALGVSKKVIKELKQGGIIDQHHYNIYNGLYLSSGSFSASTSSGHGGAGGGGVGGGGGGGR